MGRRGGRNSGKKKRGGGKKKSSSGGQQTSAAASAVAAAAAADTDWTDIPLSFDIGTRVECHTEEPPLSGTVVGHWVRLDDIPDVPAPYKIRLDCGNILYSGWDNLRELDERPINVTFGIGSRVECRLGEGDTWFPGTTIATRKTWIEEDVPPYIIKFDYGAERSFWGPPGCIRASAVAPKKTAEWGELRFKEGDRVDCCVSGGWMPGTVTKTWYDDDFENGYFDMEQLDEGALIYAPFDDDCCIRKSSVPAPLCWICFDDEQSEANLIVRECACRGKDNGFVHVDCIVKLALSKTDLDQEPDSDDPLPFRQCITCRQNFEHGSHCDTALTNAFFNVTRDCDIGNSWNKMATTMMSQLLIQNEEYDSAKQLLRERITEIRAKIESGDADPCWLMDLSNFLLDLAAVHQATDSLDEMKGALDEALCLTDILDISRGRVTEALARHASLKGDTRTALECAEQAIALAKEDKDSSCMDSDIIRYLTLLLMGSRLNIEVNNRKRGIEQMHEALEIGTRVYGRDSRKNWQLREELDKLVENSQLHEVPHHMWT